MSPSGRRRRRPGTTFATTAAIALIVVVLFVVFLVELSSNGTVKNQLGDKTFLAGRARDLAPQVSAHGPLLFADLLGKDRPVYLQHLGDDQKAGWVAIQATPTGSTCVVRWIGTGFEDPCTKTVYPPDGSGLTRYPATVLPSNRVDVDLRTPLAPAPGSSTTIATTSSTVASPPTTAAP